tara:strand:+ start:2053 stop:2181 length:129 start_codon:yes stop_codon:yes gene_type:complete
MIMKLTGKTAPPIVEMRVEVNGGLRALSKSKKKGAEILKRKF